MFTDLDKKQISERGSNLETVISQIEIFKKGFQFVNINKPATIGDGILQLNSKKAESYKELYENALSKISIIKFVPASGAASRMFKKLFEFLKTSEKQQSIEKDTSFDSMYNFFTRIKDFAFYPELKNYFKNINQDIDKLINDLEYKKIIEALLTVDNGLNYAKNPKGLLSFHKYENEIRTAFVEHLVEGVMYCKSNKNNVNLHFTVSPEHKTNFINHTNSITEKYETEYNVNFVISFSEQKSETDTIAVDENNNLFRNNDNSLVFRPGGHGALINNIQDLDEDIIFIKNIDNITIDSNKIDTIKYKKTIAGVLIETREKVYNYLQKLENSTNIKDEEINIIIDFIEKKLNIKTPPKIDNKIKYCYEKLNRPFRVCGMVKNEGEPGGGPFWVENNDKSISLQIVEASQINTNDEEQNNLLQNASHFNPVDLVCCIKNHKEEKYNLADFINHSTSFISEKSLNGKNLKALELPGLWNGAMYNWNTIFVEVPVSTFNPVKTVWDLLKPAHCNV